MRKIPVYWVLCIFICIGLTACGTRGSNALPQASIPIPALQNGEITVSSLQTDGTVNIDATANTFPPEATVVFEIDEDSIQDGVIDSSVSSHLSFLQTDATENQASTCGIDIPECPQMSENGMCMTWAEEDGSLNSSVVAELGEYISIYYMMENECTAIETVMAQIMNVESKMEVVKYESEEEIPETRKHIFDSKNGFRPRSAMTLFTQNTADETSSSQIIKVDPETTENQVLPFVFQTNFTTEKESLIVIRDENSGEILSEEKILIDQEPLLNGHIKYVEKESSAYNLFFTQPLLVEQTGLDNLFFVNNIDIPLNGPLKISKISINNIENILEDFSEDENRKILFIHRIEDEYIIVLGRFSSDAPVLYEVITAKLDLNQNILELTNGNAVYVGSNEVSFEWLKLQHVDGTIKIRLRIIDLVLKRMAEIDPNTLTTEFILPL